MLKKLSNLGEHRVYGQLAPVADRYAAEVYRKIRVADVVDIDALKSGNLGKYALMAHLDFVVADDEHTPHFAVEFDGPGHDAKHDTKKDDICRQANLALFRVNLHSIHHQIGQLSFLNYLVHLWFLALKFVESQEKGEIPPDEPFMISGFLKPDAKNIFDSEFDLLGPARGRINAFCDKNNIAKGSLSHLLVAELLMRNLDGEYAAFCSLAVDNTKIYGRTILGLKVPNYGALRQVPFAGHELGQYCTALAMDDLLDQLQIFHSGAGHVIRQKDEIRGEISVMLKGGYSPLLATHGPDDELANFARR